MAGTDSEAGGGDTGDAGVGGVGGMGGAVGGGDGGGGAGGRPAPSPGDLSRVAQDFTEGPNVEFSPWELQAARGETPLEGPRAEDALDWREFQARYDAWKEATVRFEAAVAAMRDGAADARTEARRQALELARLHHAFMESSQPYFQATKVDD